VILAGVRWYLSYPLSAWQVAELLAERGIDVSARTILSWVQTFGPLLAKESHRYRRRLGGRCYVDEVFLCRGGKKHYLYDRDRVYGADFPTRLPRLGVESVRTPVQSPRANSIAERVVRTLRRECLDHILALSERHVRAVSTEFVTYYNQDRPHRSLGLETPVPSRPPVDGKVLARPILGGLHHVYERAA
jgi:transposase InsO family protein